MRNALMCLVCLVTVTVSWFNYQRADRVMAMAAAHEESARAHDARAHQFAVDAWAARQDAVVCKYQAQALADRALAAAKRVELGRPVCTMPKED